MRSIASFAVETQPLMSRKGPSVAKPTHAASAHAVVPRARGARENARF